MKKRIMSIIMCICMIAAVLALCGFAADNGNVKNGAYEGDVWEATGNGTLSYCALDGTKLTLSKTAVDKGDNCFDINLKVVAESTDKLIIPGAAATVLLIDTSESMNYCSVCGQQYCRDKAPSRLAAAKSAAISFLDSYKGDVVGSGRFISLVQFSNKASAPLGWVDVSTKAGYDAAVKAINSMGTNYGTNLDAGICVAASMFGSPDISFVGPTNRYVVALSDGAPNLSRSGGSGIYGSAQVNADTSAAAAALRKCAAVYTIGFGIPSEYTYAGGPSVNDFLKNNIANPAVGGFTFAYSADNASQLNAVFAAISSSIKTSIGSSGSGAMVLDPMGDFVSVIACPDNFKISENGYVWQLDNVEPKVVTKSNCTTYIYTYDLTYTVKLDVDAEGFDDSVYHPANAPTFLKWSCCESFAFPVPGLKGETSHYTVIFNQGANGDIEGQDADGNVTYSDLKKWSATPAAPAVTPDSGYSFAGWTPVLADVVTCDITYVAQYVPLENTQYKIEYYLEQLDGSFALEKTEYKSGMTDTVAEVTSEDELSFSGFTLDKSVDGTVLSGNISGDGSLTLKLFYVRNSYGYSIEYYYGGALDGSKTETGSAKYGAVISSYTDKPVDGYAFTKVDNLPLVIGEGSNVMKVFYDPRTDLTYTVNYLWNGTNVTVAPSKEVYNQVLGATAEELPMNIEGYTPVSNAAKSIVIAADNNVINIYYYKDVNLTANNAEFEYDGETHSVSGFTGAPADAAFVDIEVGASGVASGTYPAAFADDVIGTVDGTAKYIITDTDDGKLVITPIATPIVITANSAEKTYDGTALTDSGYTYTEDVLLPGDELVAVVEGTQTNAGSSANAIVSYKVMHGDADVTGQYNIAECVNGTLTVTPANVTITSGSASKSYDGKALTCDTVSATGFISGEGASYNVTGSQTEVGSSKNTFEYALNDGTNASNYNITLVEGTLTVTPEAAPKTGDDSNIALWAWLMGLSAAGIAGIAIARKKDEI
ncbi:MAG: VWA domain-containing protein [Bacillota bacterium]|nr:VWA domain-containing protein [Bacillota bacterium]